MTRAVVKSGIVSEIGSQAPFEGFED